MNIRKFLKMNKNFHKCRLCLKLGEFCSIFEQDDSIKLSDMVMSFANIQIYEGDGLSDRVCSTCIENISTAYLFKLQCERISSILHQTPDIQFDKPPIADYDFINKDFYMHINNDPVNGDNAENMVKDNECGNVHYDNHDDTDSDTDSIKCVYCNEVHNNRGVHKCHVTCTIEHNQLQRSSSNETLVAADKSPQAPEPIPPNDVHVKFLVTIPCVLCDEQYNEYNAYVVHLNKCTTNVKLHHYVCPICHEIYTDKMLYLEHLKAFHFKNDVPQQPIIQKQDVEPTSQGIDNVDLAPRYIKVSKPKAVRRQIGWSIEDIYQEIDYVKVNQETPNSSPIKNFFTKLGNESFSKQSTPKKVSFRKIIETGKAKTAKPFQKYIDKYKSKRKNNGYSPIKNKVQVTSKIKASLPEIVSDSDYTSPSGTSEESWKLKQSLICACDKKIFMLSESINDKDRIIAMINELGGVVAENTKMEMLATHFISMMPADTFTGMMVCCLATGKWLLPVGFIYDSFRCKKFLSETLYEWMKHPKILEIDTTSVEVARAAVYWQNELSVHNAKFPFEGKQIVLIMKKKYRQYYQMIFKTLKAKTLTYDPRTPGSCCNADYCFVDMKVIERVKLQFFLSHNVPVFPYQYILVYLLNRGQVDDEHKYLLQINKRTDSRDTVDFLSNTY